jgi:hypothetical protein
VPHRASFWRGILSGPRWLSDRSPARRASPHWPLGVRRADERGSAGMARRQPAGESSRVERATTELVMRTGRRARLPPRIHRRRGVGK